MLNIPDGAAGPWRVEHFEMTDRSATVSALQDGHRACPAGRYTRLVRGHIIVMSDTPAEMVTEVTVVERSADVIALVRRLHSKYARRAAWQGSWASLECRG